MTKKKTTFGVDGCASRFGGSEIMIATEAQDDAKIVKICLLYRLFNDDKASQPATEREAGAATFDDRRVF